MDKIKNKGLLIGGGILVLVVLILKFTILKKKEPTNSYFASRSNVKATSSKRTTIPRTNTTRTSPSSNRTHNIRKEDMHIKKKNRTFTGYVPIYNGLQSSTNEVKSILPENLEVIQNIFQDFKKSLEQKNKAKIARTRADEAIRNLLIKVGKLKENFRKAMEKYLEQPKQLLNKANKLFDSGSYLEAENYAKRAINLCDTININTLSKLIKESVTFKYQGFYYIGNNKIAIILMIKNASGIIEGTSKEYHYVKINDILNANEENKFKVLEILQDKVVLLNIITNKKTEIPFEYENAQSTGMMEE